MTNYRHTASGLIGSIPWSTSIYSSSADSEAAANTSWVTAFEAMWTAIEALFYTNVTVTDLFTATQTAAFKQQSYTAQTVALAGTGSTQSLPYGVSVRIGFTTALKTKGSRGGMDLPPPDAAAMTATSGLTLAAASVTTLATGAGDLLANMISGSLQPILVNNRATSPTTQNITGGKVGNVLRTQRRRYSKVTPAYTTFAA